MTQMKMAAAFALVFVSGVGFAESRINQVTKSADRAPLVFAKTNNETKTVTFYAVKDIQAIDAKITEKLEAAKTDKLSKSDQADLIKTAGEKIDSLVAAKKAEKIGSMPMATEEQASRKINSSDACGWRYWGGYGYYGYGYGWGYAGYYGYPGYYGCGAYACSYVPYAYGFGCGYYGGCGGYLWW